MSDRLMKLAYGAAQGLRVSWYYGQKMLALRRSEKIPLDPDLVRRMPGRGRILRDLAALLERDFRNIALGRYQMPEEIVANPLHALRRSRAFFADLDRVERRRRSREHDEIRQNGKPDGYPSYYLQNFHFQSDGWLSRESAELYDHQVEVLFGGGAAAMRRQALVPLGTELRRCGARGTRLLDLACGTGSFLREVKANHPRLHVTALDLSPYYIEEARRTLSPWSGVDFVTAAAEAMPIPDAQFDVVTAIYLFHELPGRTRRQVAAEIARILKPGGLFILVDSLQFGDTPDYDPLLEYFPLAFHEPYYADYGRDDLAALFREAGLEAEYSELAYFSKVMSFRRKADPARP
jgi:ubiquinone/menaquinone biosynthesis C-methylase UbiE